MYNNLASIKEFYLNNFKQNDHHNKYWIVIKLLLQINIPSLSVYSRLEVGNLSDSPKKKTITIFWIHNFIWYTLMPEEY